MTWSQHLRRKWPSCEVHHACLNIRARRALPARSTAAPCASLNHSCAVQDPQNVFAAFRAFPPAGASGSAQPEAEGNPAPMQRQSSRLPPPAPNAEQHAHSHDLRDRDRDREASAVSSSDTTSWSAQLTSIQHADDTRSWQWPQTDSGLCVQLEDLHEGPDMDLDEDTHLPGRDSPELLTTDGHLGTGWGSKQDSNARLLSTDARHHLLSTRNSVLNTDATDGGIYSTGALSTSDYEVCHSLPLLQPLLD